MLIMCFYVASLCATLVLINFNCKNNFQLYLAAFFVSFSNRKIPKYGLFSFNFLGYPVFLSRKTTVVIEIGLEITLIEILIRNV